MTSYMTSLLLTSLQLEDWAVSPPFYLTLARSLMWSRDLDGRTVPSLWTAPILPTHCGVASPWVGAVLSPIGARLDRMA